MSHGLLAAQTGVPVWWFAGQMRRALFGIKVLPRGVRSTVVTYRCVGCGYLESYGSAG